MQGYLQPNPSTITINGRPIAISFYKDGNPIPSYAVEICQILYFLHTAKRFHHKTELLSSSSGQTSQGKNGVPPESSTVEINQQ